MKQQPAYAKSSLQIPDSQKPCTGCYRGIWVVYEVLDQKNSWAFRVSNTLIDANFLHRTIPGVNLITRGSIRPK